VYRLEIVGRAAKDLERLPYDMHERVQAAILELRMTPRPIGCSKVYELPGAFRIKIGDYRVIYEVADREQVVTILRVKHRREAYRDL